MASEGPAPRCAHCGQPIEHCDGRHGEWMHSLTRSEACGGQATTAWPETLNQMIERQTRIRKGRP